MQKAGVLEINLTAIAIGSLTFGVLYTAGMHIRYKDIRITVKCGLGLLAISLVLLLLLRSAAI